MCKKNQKRYYQLMGCVTLIIMLAMLVGLVITVIKQFRADAGFWPITASFLNMLATLVMGSAFANLFYSYGMNQYDEDKDNLCNVD